MHIHLIAVCGTGMGSLAGLLKKAGHHVTGSDKNVYPPMSLYLQEIGVPVMEGFSSEHLAPRPDLVIIGNAVRKENPEAQAAIQGGIEYLSFPAALRRFFLDDRLTVAVAGTHGKTTTTALIAWVLTHAGRDPSFLVGGICRNFNAPVRLGDGCHFVVEGDEYDTAFFDKVPKFVRYRPSHAILGNIEYDHADIYPDFDSVYRAFEMLVDLLPENGLLVAGTDCPNVRRLISASKAPIKTFALDHEADFTASGIRIENEQMHFRLRTKEGFEKEFRSTLLGRHNLKNILAAYAMTTALGITPDEFSDALLSFQGIRRRQEIRGEAGGATVIDDFAHHPTAVKVTLEALKMQYAPRRIIALFEPRTNTTRRNYFQKEYAEAFSSADAVIMAPVFDPEAIPEKERLDPIRLAEDISRAGVPAHYAKSYDEVLRIALQTLRENDVAVLLSNGGFGQMHERLLAALRER